MLTKIYWLIVLSAALILAGCARRACSGPPLPDAASPARWLTNGATGTIAPHHYTVTASARVEVEQAGRRFARREFELKRDDGVRTLLVNALNGDPREWHFFRPPQLPPVFSPDEAATMKPGAPVVADFITTHITETWRCRILERAGDSVLFEAPGPWLDGFTTRSTNDWMLIRWHPFRMWVHIGGGLSAAELESAFAPKNATPW